MASPVAVPHDARQIRHAFRGLQEAFKRNRYVVKENKL